MSSAVSSASLSKTSVAKSVDPDQTAPLGAVWSGYTLFVCMPKLDIDVIIYMQQTTFSDAFFQSRQRVKSMC